MRLRLFDSTFALIDTRRRRARFTQVERFGCTVRHASTRFLCSEYQALCSSHQAFTGCYHTCIAVGSGKRGGEAVDGHRQWSVGFQMHQNDVYDSRLVSPCVCLCTRRGRLLCAFTACLDGAMQGTGTGTGTGTGQSPTKVDTRDLRWSQCLVPHFLQVNSVCISGPMARPHFTVFCRPNE